MPASSATHFLIACLSIILIDLLLAGDNALVIAMAVRGLPDRQRRMGIILGAGGAVVLRILMTVAAARLLNLEFLKLAGGAFVTWIAVKVLADISSPENARPSARPFLRTVWFITMADFTMSIDNILAIAGASKGSMPLIILGLSLSIPFVMFSSNLLVVLMDRYSWIVYLGAAVLGKVGGEMMVTDPFVIRTVHPSESFILGVEALAIAGVLIAGRIASRRDQARRSEVVCDLPDSATTVERRPRSSR